MNLTHIALQPPPSILFIRQSISNFHSFRMNTEQSINHPDQDLKGCLLGATLNVFSHENRNISITIAFDVDVHYPHSNGKIFLKKQI